MEKEENAIVFENFPFVYDSAVFLRKLIEKKKNNNKFLVRKKKMKNLRVLIVFVCVMAAVNFASADTIRGIDIDFVTIGNASNAPDTQVMTNDGTTGYGAVSSNYRIGKYEVTATQWQTINTAAGIGDSGYWSGNQPVASISWY